MLPKSQMNRNDVNFDITRVQATNYINSCVVRRQVGYKTTLGTRDLHNKIFYSTMAPCKLWDPYQEVNQAHPGAIFNLEFSPDGSILVAACEKKKVLIFDPLNSKLINSIEGAHSNFVNCAKFLDARMFATCSDDFTVNIWDVRYCKTMIRTLKGHQNWVKNIEFDHRTGLIITSAFDGSIYTWDINKYKEEEQFTRVFHTDRLMRTKLSPDGTKLVLCTSGGYIMVIHDLDLHTLATDLQEFKPNMYRLLQLSVPNLPVLPGRCGFNSLFRTNRNRVELISDFPSGNDAEVISSLQVHPHGWCCLSRNTSRDENSEWTCIHDIQELPFSQDQSADEVDSKAFSEQQSLFSPPPTNPNDTPPPAPPPLTRTRSSDRLRLTFTLNPGHDAVRISGNSLELNVPESHAFIEAFVPVQYDSLADSVPAVLSSPSPSSSDDDTAQSGPGGDQMSSASAEHGVLRFDLRSRNLYIVQEGSSRHSHSVLFVGQTGPTQAGSPRVSPAFPNEENGEPSQNEDSTQSDHNRFFVHQNIHRLTHYAEEPNVGRGFIKELCFSPDGRLVCSPFSYGVRLLAFNPACSELCDCVPQRPMQMFEVSSNIAHTSPVVSTQFSPVHCLLASGCLGGKVCFYSPRFG